VVPALTCRAGDAAETCVSKATVDLLRPFLRKTHVQAESPLTPNLIFQTVVSKAYVKCESSKPEDIKAIAGFLPCVTNGIFVDSSPKEKIKIATQEYLSQ
jgi:hypothetical protein